MLLVDAANVVGSRPTGWWRDRAGATRQLIEQIGDSRRAGLLPGPVVVVLEGAARDGMEEGKVDDVEIIHASGEGDERIAALALAASEPVLLVSADRVLRERLRYLGVRAVGPMWLLDRFQSPPDEHDLQEE